MEVFEGSQATSFRKKLVSQMYAFSIDGLLVTSKRLARHLGVEGFDLCRSASKLCHESLARDAREDFAHTVEFFVDIHLAREFGQGVLHFADTRDLHHLSFDSIDDGIDDFLCRRFERLLSCFCILFDGLNEIFGT